jgi:hypothetical protein
VAPPIANPPRRESILVVYGEGKGQLADQIRSWFLNEGYNSSATSTDFTELGKAAQAPGTVKLRAFSGLIESLGIPKVRRV